MRQIRLWGQVREGWREGRGGRGGGVNPYFTRGHSQPKLEKTFPPGRQVTSSDSKVSNNQDLKPGRRSGLSLDLPVDKECVYV